MAKPPGAMSSPFTGFAKEMKNTNMFNTVGTEQNLPTREDIKENKVVTPPVQPIVNQQNNKFTPEELGTLIVKAQGLGTITSASLDEIVINVNGTLIHIHK